MKTRRHLENMHKGFDSNLEQLKEEIADQLVERLVAEANKIVFTSTCCFHPSPHFHHLKIL
ncbi:hypothetical protein KPL84_00835 [Bacillus anthracis]|nr:hypothetical protein [Bacillus anthracis]MCD1171677.1 hypothetical protein [Bacillus anthracis]